MRDGRMYHHQRPVRQVEQPRRELVAVGTRHLEVGDDEVKGLARDTLKRFLAVFRVEALETLLRQGHGDSGASDPLVVDHEDFVGRLLGWHGSAPSSSRLRGGRTETSAEVRERGQAGVGFCPDRR